MSLKKQKSFSSKFSLLFRYWRKAYPIQSYFFKWLVICVLMGSCIGTATAGFLHSLNWATHYRDKHLWLVLLLPLGGLLIGLLYHYFGKAVEAGNNLLLDTIYEPKSKIPFRMAPFVYIGTLTTHLLGGSAGREGTALQMAGAIADQFTKPFNLDQEDRKTLVIAAIAAGFGAVFGTPLAGAIFALEVCLIDRLRYHAILPAFAAALIADLVCGLWQVQHDHYQIGDVPNSSFLFIFYAVVAGLAFGCCAALFSKVLHFTSAVFKSTIVYPPFRPLVGGIIIAIAAWLIGTGQYLGLGIPTITLSFGQTLPSYTFALKMAFTIVTLAAGFKGGEVTPLFFIGATLGNVLAYFIPLPIGLLAGMGFVAVFAGATNAPLACTIMAIELFGSTCGIYVAIACFTAYLCSGQTGIYKQQRTGAIKYQRLRNLVSKRLKDL